jgi:hypothetical protein
MALKLLSVLAVHVVIGAEQLAQNSLPFAPVWIGSGYRTIGDSRSIVRYLKSGKHTCTNFDNFTYTTCVNKLLGHFERKVVIKCMSCIQNKHGHGSLAQFCSEKPDENGDLKVTQVGYDDMECQQPQGQWGFLAGTEKKVPSVHAGCFQDDPFHFAMTYFPVAFPAPIACEFAEYSSLDRYSCFDSPRGASCKAALNTCKNHGKYEENTWCNEEPSETKCMQNPHAREVDRGGEEQYEKLYSCVWNELNFASVYYNFEEDMSSKVMV